MSQPTRILLSLIAGLVVGALLGVLLWPLFISPQIIGFGAILAYGPYGLITAYVGDAIGVPRG